MWPKVENAALVWPAIAAFGLGNYSGGVRKSLTEGSIAKTDKFNRVQFRNASDSGKEKNLPDRAAQLPQGTEEGRWPCWVSVAVVPGGSVVLASGQSYIVRLGSTEEEGRIT